MVLLVGCNDDGSAETDANDDGSSSSSAADGDDDDGDNDDDDDDDGGGPDDDGNDDGPNDDGNDDGPDTGGPEPSSGCGNGDAQTGAWQHEIEVPGVGTRSFYVSIPEPYDADAPHRLYFAVHGTGWTGSMIAPYYNIEGGGDGNELFIYPDRDPGFSNLETTGAQADADLAYFDAVLDWARTTYCIDDTRVFAMGHSGGGNWVTFLSCHRGSQLRAVIPAGTGGAWWYQGLSPGDVSACDGPVAAMVVHGTQDALIPYDPWGLETLDYFRTLNGCEASTTEAFAGTSCLRMAGCTESYDCSHDEPTFLGDGHQIPGWYPEVMTWLRGL